MDARAQSAPVYKKATFAGGCFWCMEPAFEKLEGVREVIAGYAGGSEPNPTYEEVSLGATGYSEAIQVSYDPDTVSYAQLLDVFWKSIDPTDDGGQFADRGAQYRSAVYYHDEQQKQEALASRNTLEASGIFSRPVVTPVSPFTTFYPAEEYHQDYYKKQPEYYESYRSASGRQPFLDKLWCPVRKGPGAPNELKQRLSPLQFKVTQEEATEPAFRNEYWDNKREGIYVDIVSGEPLFSSSDKFDSVTGWPSFVKPLESENIVEKQDRSIPSAVRTEVRSKNAGSHLGHVFADGPEPSGLRYCINSASLRFIPKEQLEKEGYGRYLKLFE